MIDIISMPINSLLERNNIDIKNYLNESYNCLLISIFETIVNEPNNIQYKKELKQRILNSSNKILTTQKIVYEKTKCKLSEEESKMMYEYIYAYLTKNNSRETYDTIIKNKLLTTQNNKCNICKKNINISSSELDHIVPWTFVGDELGLNNLQMLCIDCNRRKSKNSSYNLKMFLINK